MGGCHGHIYDVMVGVGDEIQHNELGSLKTKLLQVYIAISYINISICKLMDYLMKMKKWLLQSAILIAIISFRTVSCGNATLEGTQFKYIVVGISTAVLSDNHDSNTINDLITKLKELLTKTSDALFVATGNRLSFDTITILEPVNWDVVQSQNILKREASLFAPGFPTFEMADIRVDVPNIAYGDIPYTQQTGFCGERGDFIHITESFIKSVDGPDANRDKYLAREWVKYFFGVFDEQGYAFSEMYPVKYFADNGMAILNSCSNTEVEWTTEECHGNGKVSGLPDYCDLKTDNQSGRNSQLNSSMMSYPIAAITSYFCSNESHHNADAPNMQNVFCDGKSIMEVILSNPQLIDQGSQGNTPPQPVVSISKMSLTNVMSLGVLWDNMNKSRTIYSAIPAFSKFVMYDMPQQAFIKITATEQSLNQDWTKIASNENREQLIETINSIQNGNSNGNIVQTFTELITGIPTDTVNAVVIISERDDVTSLCQLAKDNGIQLHLISYNTGNAVGNFIKNSVCSGHAIQIQSLKSPFDDDVWDSQVQDCYKYLNERKQFDDFIRALPNVIASAIYGPPQTFYENMFYDSSTDVFYLSQPIYTSTTSMTDRFYYEACENLNDDNGFPIDSVHIVKCSVVNPTINCVLDEKAYTYCGSRILNTSTTLIDGTTFACNSFPIQLKSINQTAPYVVYAVGQPASSVIDPKYPQITLNQWVATDSLNQPYTKVRIFAKLTYGTTPILEAQVNATVITSSQTVNITLRDDGSGNPDITAMDGVYTAYFTQFTESTVYTVTVIATDNDKAYYPTVQYPWITNNNQYGPGWLSFTQTASAGSFYAVNGNTGSIPPGRILDLRVSSSDSESVTLSWTAPGADLDYGTVDEYRIKCSSTKDDLSITNFDPTEDQADNIPSVAPSEAGAKQSVRIGGSPDGKTYYCSVRAKSGLTQFSDPSNIVPYSIMYNGLTSGQIAGISIGVIIIVILIVLLGIFLFYKLSHKSKKTVASGNLHSTQPNDDKLKPIVIESVPIEAIHHPGYGVENDAAQRRSHPNSYHNSSFSVSESDHGSQHIGNTQMLTFQSSRSSSPKPVPPPKVPTPPIIQPIEVIALGSPPNDTVVYNARPHPIERQEEETRLYVIQNADVARPIKLTQVATLEDTGDYQEHSTFRPDIPLYNHILSKPPVPPPKRLYAANESFSSTSTSSSDHTNRTPKLNSAV
ncbi:chloride channel [Chamberlinius hualienensis]